MSSEDLPKLQQFIINDETYNDDRQTIFTDLYTAIIYLNQFKKTQMNGGYIQIPYFMPSGTMRPNAIYTENVTTKKYKCKNLYVFKASHNIAMDSKFDGELVLELVPTTNTSDKLYLCFLLENIRYTNTESNQIDKLINVSIKPPVHYSTMNMDLDKLIEKKQKKIIYKSGIDTVVIFTTPIKIKEMDFTIYSNIPEQLLAIYPVNDNYKILVPSINEGFYGNMQEGLTGDSTEALDTEIEKLFNRNLITCTPVDDNDNSIVKNQTATYLVDGSKNSNMAQAAIGSAFIITLVAISASYFGAPFFYEHTIANFITKDTTLTLVTWFIAFVSFILGFILLLNGIGIDDNQMWVGGYIILFLVLSTLSIALKRNMTKPNIDMADISATMDDIKNIVARFGVSLFYKRDDPTKFDKWFISMGGIVFAVLLIILSIISATLSSYSSIQASEKKVKGYTTNLQGIIMGIGSVYGLMTIIWIVLAAKFS